MEVGMMEECLGPGVKYREEADPCSKVLGIGGDGLQGLGSGAEEQAVAQALVLKRDGREFVGKCEDDVEVRYFEEIALAVGEPLGRS
jgi:hypothetical protein